MHEADPRTPILVEPADWGAANGLKHLDLQKLNPKGEYPVRWAGGWSGDEKRGRPVPDAEQFMEHLLGLIEKLGANHALWKWDPRECFGDDDFDFTHGQLFSQHNEVESDLERIIRRYWQSNSERPPPPR